jgi:hypothetical protein
MAPKANKQQQRLRSRKPADFDTIQASMATAEHPPTSSAVAGGTILDDMAWWSANEASIQQARDHQAEELLSRGQLRPYAPNLGAFVVNVTTTTENARLLAGYLNLRTTTQLTELVERADVAAVLDCMLWASSEVSLVFVAKSNVFLLPAELQVVTGRYWSASPASRQKTLVFSPACSFCRLAEYFAFSLACSFCQLAEYLAFSHSIARSASRQNTLHFLTRLPVLPAGRIPCLFTHLPVLPAGRIL